MQGTSFKYQSNDVRDTPVLTLYKPTIFTPHDLVGGEVKGSNDHDPI